MITLPYRREPCHGQSVPGEAAVAVDDLSVSMPGDDRLALDSVTLIGANWVANGAGRAERRGEIDPAQVDRRIAQAALRLDPCLRHAGRELPAPGGLSAAAG